MSVTEIVMEKDHLQIALSRKTGKKDNFDQALCGYGTEEIASCCVILLIAFRNPLGEKNKLRTWLTKLVNRQTTPASSMETRQIDSRDIGLTEKF
ncbi:hypothetical protein ACF0H5_005951 [Mactra antiquata]